MEPDKSDESNYTIGLLQIAFTTFGGVSVTEGLFKLADHYRAVSSIRDAVLQNAGTITPDVIAYANELATSVDFPNDYLINLSAGFTALSTAYLLFHYRD